LIGGQLSNFTRLRPKGAIKNTDRIGFELDSELLNCVLEGFLADGYLNRAVVFARGQFALDEYAVSFTKRKVPWAPGSERRIP